MTLQTLIVIVVVGAALAWAAEKYGYGTGGGPTMDYGAGIVGAFVAVWLVPKAGVALPAGIVGTAIASAVGAAVVLFAARYYQGGTAAPAAAAPAPKAAAPKPVAKPAPAPAAPMVPERPMPRRAAR
ncbi:GlsB/YeaQ/YmgE family stress response membrane protein [Rhodovulum sp. PH10]|uniref:GlsB/YeaQ/YmgE family stress response membrane protein n=1 Tax=Rhodovulum sp. PH10 TaxID=1187851 RepID=UPI0012F9EF9C|nr:GlsB/YeaQ/YmgE family stress response membrane protein [Rhodovulum sp. PH10]